MSILINGIEMPKDEELLSINIYPDGKVTIGMDLECKQIATAIPVSPHGQLTDAEMTRELVRDCNNLVRICKEIEGRVVSLAKPSAQPAYTMEEFMYGQDMGNPEDGSL